MFDGLAGSYHINTPVRTHTRSYTRLGVALTSLDNITARSPISPSPVSNGKLTNSPEPEAVPYSRHPFNLAYDRREYMPATR